LPLESGHNKPLGREFVATRITHWAFELPRLKTWLKPSHLWAACGAACIRASVLALAVLGAFSGLARAQDLLRMTVALPGPGALAYLPVDLIKKIGADRAEGVDLSVRHFRGGPLAVAELLRGNSDFAALGMPALAAFKAHGREVVSIAAMCRVPAFVLLVRADLKPAVRGARDLRGRVIGVNASSLAEKSTSQQWAEYVVGQAGLPIDSVNYFPAGQAYAEQKAALASGVVDALMGDEPFASLLQQEGLAYALADFHDPAATRPLGGPFLYTQLATRPNLLVQQPDKVRKMVAVLRRSLRWLATHQPEEVVAALAPPDSAAAAAVALTGLLTRHPALFSADGAFSAHEVAGAERFFHAAHAGQPQPAALRLRALIDSRYAGETD
jgi:NitT/TauT family transport system substrate-binding protein